MVSSPKLDNAGIWVLRSCCKMILGRLSISAHFLEWRTNAEKLSTLPIIYKEVQSVQKIMLRDVDALLPLFDLGAYSLGAKT